MKTQGRAAHASTQALPDHFHKRHLAGFACPACNYKGWNAFVATGLDQTRRAQALFWCPSCRGEFLFQRPAWLWLGLRTLFLQTIGFAALYAVVMLLQKQTVPWLMLLAITLGAACVLLVFTMVLRSPSGYHRLDHPDA
jgi:hypothetical protein